MGEGRRYQCQACGKTFCSTTGTANYRLQHRRTTFDEASFLSVEDLNKSAVARVKRVSIPAYNNLGFHAYYAGRLDEATMALKKALEHNAAFPRLHVLLGRVRLARAQPQQALNEMELETDPVWRQFGLSVAYHAVGRKTEADTTLARFVDKYGETMAYQIAEVFAYRGEVDRASEWLERAYRLRDSGMSDLKGDPLLRSLERDSRYSALLRKMRLPLS